MSGIRYGISTSAITWEKEESEIEQDETGKCTITVVGSVGVSESPTPLDTALDMLPYSIPVMDDGPIGASVKYSGAKKAGQSARYLGDDTIQVRATYIISVPTNQTTFPGDEGDTSDSDRAQRSIVTEEAPVLSHPIVQEFSTNARRNLASLLAGDIRVNPRFNSDGTDSELWEFIKDKEQPDEGVEQVTFESVTATLMGVTASPIDYARAIAAGVTIWKRPVIRHSLTKARNAPATNAEYGKVGEVIATTPPLAPDITGDFQWFLNGITDTTETGEAWTTTYEYELSGAGGVLKILYPGGTAELQ